MHGCGHGGPPWAGGHWGGGGWHRRWHGGGGWGGWHGHHGHHRNPWLWAVLERLDLSPAQEKLVRTELEQLAERMRGLKSEVKAARSDLGRSVAGEAFDPGALDAMFNRHDVALGDVRAAVTAALGRIHEALDTRQREALADLLGGGLFRGMGFGGPYRM
jgi:hypothetical protein